MSAGPSISVVTPSCSQGRFIERCIQSVLAQNYPNFEHIICDNCSRDGTVDVLRRYPHLHWISEPDRGQSDALNKAIRRSTGEIIAWINADDFYEPGAFHVAARELGPSTGGRVVAGAVRVIDAAGCIRETAQPQFAGLEYLIEFWLHSYGLCQPGVLFRREVVERVGLFRTDLHFAMDYDYWLRVAQHFSIRTVPEILANYVLHEQSKTVRGRHRTVFWDEMERVSRPYWGARFSRRRRRRARSFRRHAADRLAGVLLHGQRQAAAFEWRLWWRLLRSRPARMLDRHLVAAVAEHLLGYARWQRLKYTCGWTACSRREGRP